MTGGAFLFLPLISFSIQVNAYHFISFYSPARPLLSPVYKDAVFLFPGFLSWVVVINKPPWCTLLLSSWTLSSRRQWHGRRGGWWLCESGVPRAGFRRRQILVFLSCILFMRQSFNHTYHTAISVLQSFYHASIPVQLFFSAVVVFVVRYNLYPVILSVFVAFHSCSQLRLFTPPFIIHS